MTTTGARSSLVLAEASWPQARGVAGAGARRRRAQRSASGAALLGQRCVAARSSSSDVPADTPAYEDLEAQAEAFMRQQSALETGETDEAESPTSVSYETSAAATQEYGSDEVSDDQVAVFESEALESFKLLLKNRDMTLNEVKLILAIEDPRAQEARRVYGIETESGVSREEIAQCLIYVAERRPVANRIALRELRRELQNWPDLVEEEERTAAGAAVTVGADAPEGDYDSPMAAGDLAKPAANPRIGRDDEERQMTGMQKELLDMLPDWMGYGVLYSFSIVPIVITVVAVSILWVNSFS